MKHTNLHCTFAEFWQIHECSWPSSLWRTLSPPPKILPLFLFVVTLCSYPPKGILWFFFNYKVFLFWNFLLMESYVCSVLYSASFTQYVFSFFHVVWINLFLLHINIPWFICFLIGGHLGCLLSFWLLWIKLLLIFLYKSFGEHVFISHGKLLE